jgi:hypothetical protein
VIGGHDMVLDGAGPADEGVFLVSELRRVWPELVVQNAEAEEAVSPDAPSIERMTEFFVYRSRGDFDSWTAHGATEANADTMIHVILGEVSTTLVTHRAGSASYGHAEKLGRAVIMHRIVSQLGAERGLLRSRPPEAPGHDLHLKDRLLAVGDRQAPFESAA